MASTTIPQLPLATSLDGTEQMEIVQAGTSMRTTIGSIPSTKAVWGGITGTLSAQTDLQTALNLKAPLDSPTFTGVLRAATTSVTMATARQEIIADSEVLTPPTFVGSVMSYLMGTTDATGHLSGRFSNNTKGVLDYCIKSRGATIGDLAPVALGDKIYTFAPFGSSAASPGGGPGNGIAHIGQMVWFVDGVPRSVVPVTEIPGGWHLDTCTGDQFLGSRTALSLSYNQKVYLAGPNGTNPGPGVEMPAVVTIGAGSAAANGAQLKRLGGTILTTPEAFANEVDAAGIQYVSDASAIRSRVMVAPTAAPTAVVNVGAGTGGTATLVVAPNGGRLTIVTGTSPTLNGIIAKIDFATAFATDCVCAFSPANANAAVVTAQMYMTGSASQLTLTNNGTALAASTTYIIEFTYSGF